MSEHISNVKKAIEFNHPDYLPMEIIDVPGIYNAYHTLDPGDVKLIPGTENFDSIWASCYSWQHRKTGTTVKGEILKQDQFGTILKTPLDMNSAYILIDHPLKGKNILSGYDFPDPDDLDPVFNDLGQIIADKYPDRFINGTIDAGVFLTIQLLLGSMEFLTSLADNINYIVELYEKVTEYYKRLIPKYRKAGVHMITEFEDLGGTSSLMLNPDTWRKYFKPIISRFFKYIHQQGLYTGILIDGHSGQILEDILEMEIDVLQIADIHTTGISLFKDKLKGKKCVKASVDMQRTLPVATGEQVYQEACLLSETFHTPAGGFICEVVRWHRPEFPAENVTASIRGFNRFRKDIPV